MKVVCISDTHGDHKLVTNLPEGDMIIHAGDVSDMGTESQIIDFLIWFYKLPYRYKIFIAGNHDFYIQKYATKFRELLQHYPEVIYLEDNEIEIEGKRIYGSPWTPQFGGWAFMKDRGDEEHQMKGVWNKIPYGLDLLIVHGPPYGVLDNTRDGIKAGCANLLVATVREKVKNFVCGHIHEGNGKQSGLFTNFYNVSLMNEDYQLVYKPIVIEI